MSLGLDGDGHVPVAEHGEPVAHVVLAAAERLCLAVPLHLRHRAHGGHVVDEIHPRAVHRLLLGVAKLEMQDVLAGAGRIRV